MKFSEFFKLHEATVRGIKNYVATKLKDGQFVVELIKTPKDKWVIQIVNGVLVLPPELEPHREDIYKAYFDRYPGFNNAGNTTGSHDSPSDIFGSQTGSINIKNSDAQTPSQNNTFAFKPHSPQRV